MCLSWSVEIHLVAFLFDKTKNKIKDKEWEKLSQNRKYQKSKSQQKKLNALTHSSFSDRNGMESHMLLIFSKCDQWILLTTQFNSHTQLRWKRTRWEFIGTFRQKAFQIDSNVYSSCVQHLPFLQAPANTFRWSAKVHLITDSSSTLSLSTQKQNKKEKRGDVSETFVNKLNGHVTVPDALLDSHFLICFKREQYSHTHLEFSLPSCL